MDDELAGNSRTSPGATGLTDRLNAEQRYAFLAEAGRALAASLDYEETLSTIAARPLPFLGAWCVVDLLEEDGSMRRAAILHPEPEKQAAAEQLRAGWPPTREDPFGIPTVLRTRAPELVQAVPDELLPKLARDTENLRILRTLRIGSLITVPMVVWGKVIGAITYVAPEAGHTFTEADVALATDLAALSALAVENARLHRAVMEAEREASTRRDEAEYMASLVAGINERLLVSAVKELESADAARATEAAKSQFMASLSHELRTPLSAITGYADLIAEGVMGPVTEKQATSARQIMRGAEQVLRLIDQLLTYARLDAQREPVRLEPVDVIDIAQQAIALVTPLASKKDLELIAELPSDAVVVRTDGDKLGQILLNLLSNAIKFTEAGHVRVTADVDGSVVRFRVIDTGRGIPERDQERIFEPFLQAENAGGGTVGTGLGLAITRAFLQLLGGRLELSSEPGRGSTFTVTLPLEPEQRGDMQRSD